jgi:AcrR family transcriptional regulator
VFDAAVEIFHERGYADTSVEDVANAVGLLKGSLYYYIDSKEDLLFQVVDDVHRDVQQMLDAAMAEPDVPPLEQLARFVRRQVEYNARNVKRIAVYYHDFGRLEGDRLAEVRGRRRRQEQIVIDLLEQARRSGDVHPELDTELAARFVFAPMIWIYTWYREGTLSPEALAGFCADFVLNGVRGVGFPAAPESMAG